MASRFETFSKNDIWAINEAVVQAKNQESQELWLVSVNWWVENGFMRNLQQKRKTAFDKIPGMFVTCEQSSYYIYKK